MAKEVEIVEGSQILVKGTKDAPFYIHELQNIAPIAAHIKEVNHIDPISVEALHVSQVRNIEPISIDKFNVTNLPPVNLSLRQLPPVELEIRKLPALSIGTHQWFELPSRYTLRAMLLGIEVLRLQLAGCTRITPRERYRREQANMPSLSVATVATAGNPAIPSFHAMAPSAAGKQAALSLGAPQSAIPLSKQEIGG